MTLEREEFRSLSTWVDGLGAVGAFAGHSSLLPRSLAGALSQFQDEWVYDYANYRRHSQGRILARMGVRRRAGEQSWSELDHMPVESRTAWTLSVLGAGLKGVAVVAWSYARAALQAKGQRVRAEVYAFFGEAHLRQLPDEIREFLSVHPHVEAEVRRVWRAAWVTPGKPRQRAVLLRPVAGDWKALIRALMWLLRLPSHVYGQSEATTGDLLRLEFLAGSLPRLLRSAAILRGLEEDGLPRLALFSQGSHWAQSGLMRTLMDRGCRAVELAHGVAENVLYYRTPAGATLLFGGADAELLASFGVPRETIFVVGKPEHPGPLPQPSPSPHSTLLLSFTAPVSKSDAQALLDLGVGVARELGLPRVRLRPHPVSGANEIRSLVESSPVPNDVNIVWEFGRSLDEDLAEAAACISMWSSILRRIGEVGIPCLAYAPEGLSRVSVYGRIPDWAMVDTGDEAAGVAKRIQEDRRLCDDWFAPIYYTEWPHGVHELVGEFERALALPRIGSDA